MAKGENHESSGVSAPPFTRATTANSSRAPTWRKIMTRCTIAESSVPSTQMVVITAMMGSVKTTLATVESRRASRPNRSNV